MLDEQVCYHNFHNVVLDLKRFLIYLVWTSESVYLGALPPNPFIWAHFKYVRGVPDSL